MYSENITGLSQALRNKTAEMRENFEHFLLTFDEAQQKGRKAEIHTMRKIFDKLWEGKSDRSCRRLGKWIEMDWDIWEIMKFEWFGKCANHLKYDVQGVVKLLNHVRTHKALNVSVAVSRKDYIASINATAFKFLEHSTELNAIGQRI